MSEKFEESKVKGPKNVALRRNWRKNDPLPLI
jgi:hypothetical protein